MSNQALTHAPAVYGAKNRQPGTARPGAGRTGLTGLLVLGGTLGLASAVLGARTWQVGADLGANLFPVQDIVELLAVAIGTVAAGWVALHALVALACVVVSQHGLRWAAGERAVARHAPAVVRRLARAAAGAGLGLALAAPTAIALPDRDAGPATAGNTDDTRPAVVLDLRWEPTTRTASKQSPRAGAARESRVAVEPGDTLWAIAAAGLTSVQGGSGQAHPAPSDAEIAAAVTRWHQANREVLGANPDLIRPGTVLRRP